MRPSHARRSLPQPVFEPIPAIDLKDGRCVRLVQGDFARSTVFDDDPAGVARRWASAGATRIHVVDLDGAKSGRPMQLAVVRAIVRAVDVPVQVGGGLRSLTAIEAAFAAGAERVILGSAALSDPSFLDACLERFGERVSVGIDARDGRVAVHGWVDVSDTDAVAFARDVSGRGVSTIVYTDIGVDGMLVGPNLPAMRTMVEAVPNVDVIASGGVGRLDDVVALSQTGAAGVVIGKALYTGNVDLAEAIATIGALDGKPTC